MAAGMLSESQAIRSVAKWVFGILASLLVATAVSGAAKVVEHDRKLAVIETRYDDILRRLESIDKKLDKR